MSDGTMRERLADIIAPSLASFENGGTRQRYALRIVEALLDELAKPSPAMIEAARRAEARHYLDDRDLTAFTWPCTPGVVIVKMWTAMIDEALK